MSVEQSADHYFVTLRDMFHKGIISQEAHDELQDQVNRWAELPDEMNVYGICPSGQCEM
jgi:hypothetical protein